MCCLHLQKEQEVMGSSPCTAGGSHVHYMLLLCTHVWETPGRCYELHTMTFQGYLEICFLSGVFHAHRMILYPPEVSCEAVHVLFWRLIGALGLGQGLSEAVFE